MRTGGTALHCFFIHAVTVELFEFFSQDVFVRNGLYLIRLKGSSKPHDTAILPPLYPILAVLPTHY
jgi:hypothetical protein